MTPTRIEVKTTSIFLNGKAYKRGFYDIDDTEVLKSAEEATKKFPNDIEILKGTKKEEDAKPVKNDSKK